MAHFAKLDENNVVTRVVVVKNSIPTSNGPLGENDMHVDGETWCQNFFKGGTWKQTSYNHRFRKQFAGLGYTYNPSMDIFIAEQPFPSWTLDSNGDWNASVTYPSVTEYGNNGKKYGISWDEENQRWYGTDSQGDIYDWNSETLTWSLR